MRKNQEKDLADIIAHVYTDDLKICVLKLRYNHDMQKGDSCVSLGIPNSDFNIDYVQNTIHSLILGADCKFVGFDPTRQDYVFECDDVAKLNGMSGGPILFKDTVIAVQHSVNIKENKIYGTPLTIRFINEASKHWLFFIKNMFFNINLTFLYGNDNFNIEKIVNLWYNMDTFERGRYGNNI